MIMNWTIFKNPRSAKSNFDRLQTNPFGKPLFQKLRPEIGRILAAVPDPDQALNHFERMAQAVINQTSFYHFLSAYPHFLEILLTLFGHSNYLADIMIRHPEYFYWLVTSGINQIEFDPDSFYREFNTMSGQYTSTEKKVELLKRLKRREILRIGTLDIMGWSNFQTTVRNLSDLADAIVETVLTLHSAEFNKKFGTVTEDFSIIGLGKLGGRELNYSSDIDIIFVYSEEGVGTRLDTKKAFTTHEYFNQLAEKIVHTLSTFSNGEALYRVDTRLRPDGASGPLARSFASYLHYYELRGQLWERQMLIKARPVAGNLPFGHAYLNALQAFVYPKTFFKSPLEEIGEIKRTIEEKLAGQQTDQVNIKLRHGGIRDIEFSIQALQLMNGGIFSDIRESNSLKAIENLHYRKLLTDSEAVDLKEAYIFFRKIEHHLQLENWRQTHLLPTDSKKLIILTRKMGFQNRRDFRKAVHLHTKKVGKIYNSIMGETVPPQADDFSEEILLSEKLTPAVKSHFIELGFKKAEQSHQAIQKLLKGSRQKPLTPAAGHSFQSLFPKLLKEVQRQPSADQALLQFSNAAGAYGSPQNLYNLMNENPKFLSLLAQICGRAPLFARSFGLFPEFLSILTNVENLHLPFAKTSFKTDFSQRMESTNAKDWFNQLLRLKNFHFVRIGVRFEAGLVSPEQAFRELSDLADGTLELTLSHVLTGHAWRGAFPAAVLALGKLGSQELNFGSDLDVIFLTAEEKDPPLQTQEAVLQKLISGLNRITPWGQLYKIDARLRPEGAQAPLLISVDSYKKYLLNRSQLWERQALLRVRLIAGNPAVWDKLSLFLQDFIFHSAYERKQIEEIFSMLENIHRKARRGFSKELDFKNSPGGIVDIEFLTQALQLKYGRKFEEIRRGTPIDILPKLADRRILSADDAGRLRESYHFYRLIETYLHIGLERPKARIPLQPEKLDFLAKALGFETGEAFLKTLRSQMETVREILRKTKNQLSRRGL